mgnify:CR=1 FL=1
MSYIPYVDQPCERCGSKKRVSKTWTKTVPIFNGTTELEYSQIVCTNPVCQRAFDKNLKEETKKREVIRLEKEEKDKMRKANSLLQARKN